MKVGAICSAGGSAFSTAIDLLASRGLYQYSDVSLVTDRKCGIDDWCAERSISHVRFNETDNRRFSEMAASFFREAGCDIILLYFSRLVTKELFSILPVLNIHPSALPAFPGFKAITNAQNAGVRFLGATLHIASHHADGGKIIAQVNSPISNDPQKEHLERISYIQKVYLTLCAIDLTRKGYFKLHSDAQSLEWLKPPRVTASANPALASGELIEAFDDFQDELGVNAITP